MILMKRKKAQKDKDKSAPLVVPDQKVQAKTASESKVSATMVQDTSQSCTSPVPEMTVSQLPQIPEAQPLPQLPPATATEPAPSTQAEKQLETVTPSVEAPVMETEPQPQVQHEPTMAAPPSKDTPQEQPVPIVDPDKTEPDPQQ